jgi:AcrR family transcriptional regulator
MDQTDTQEPGVRVDVKLSKSERSARTKATILAAARANFAEHGYQRATIRQIATDAQIDPSMVMRYYGDKRGLFEAATDIDLSLPDLTKVPAGRRGRAAIEHFLRLWDGPAPNDVMRLLLASAVNDEMAAEQVRHILATQLQSMVAAVAPDHESVRTRTGMIAAQILGLALTRYLLRVPEISELDPATIVTNMSPIIEHLLSEPLDPAAT